MAEFTGERLVPGESDPDLFNEHISRYYFAARLCRFKKVIDLGCGMGYGSAELAKTALSVVGVDVDPETVAEAAATYILPNLNFETASVSALPFADQSFDAGVCFEVIEHLEDYRSLLKEARRVIHPHGQFIVSTPNKLYYAEARRLSGPNPFHAHEFTFEEFRSVLAEFFPHQTFFLQNHTAAILFAPTSAPGTPELRVDSSAPEFDSAHFFVAVCSGQPQLGAPSFLYVPQSANVLAERERHIQRLEGELRTKDAWLETTKSEHADLVEKHRAVIQELEAKNQWALERNKEVEAAQQAVTRIEQELARTHQEAQAIATDYEAKLSEAEKRAAEFAAWARGTEERLTKEMAELQNHIANLDAQIASAAEALTAAQAKINELDQALIERTQWAQTIEAERASLETRLAGYEASRWTRLGRSLGLGPKNA
jgi:SAM-dependent methyltransferase